VFDDYKSKLEDLNDLKEPIHTEEEIKHEAITRSINKMLNEFNNYKSKVEIEDEYKNEDYQGNVSIEETRNKNKGEILKENQIKIKIKNKNNKIKINKKEDK